MTRQIDNNVTVMFLVSRHISPWEGDQAMQVAFDCDQARRIITPSLMTPQTPTFAGPV